MFEKLKEGLSKFARIGVADSRAVETLVKDLQRSLIQADVNVKLVFELSKRVKEKALKEKLPPGMSRREHVIDIVYKELVSFLGDKKPDVKLGKQKILLLGLFGSGKTTTTAKLASFYKQRGLSVGIIGCDTWRPAALKQLQTLGKKIDVPVYGDEKEKDASKIVKNGLKELKGKDVIIVDSAGRSALDSKLSAELRKVEKALKPDERLLVLSGDIGQAAEKQSAEFDKLVKLTGITVTKMDSTAKGGGVLSACHAAGVKVKFIGVGEKLGDLEIYDPVRYVSRILGMGDLEGLLEKAKKAVTPEKAAEFAAGEFDLEQFCEQIESAKSMGSFKQILDMLPGGAKLKIPTDVLDVQEDKMSRWKHMLDSMTPEERRKPELLDKPRVERIAKGSGTRPEEVRELLKHFNQTKKMIKKLKSGKALKRGGMGKLFKGLGI